MDLQGQPIPSGPRSTKVTTDPQARQPITEPSGPVTNDSLAAESTRTGGGYSGNRGAEPLGVSGGSSTFNNTNTSGATKLSSAATGSARENLDRQQKYPEALGGQGDFPGAHVPETGYVGGPTATKEKMGIHGGEYPASQKLSGNNYRSEYNAGIAPSYTTGLTQNLGNTKPKGNNITEGGFDSNAPNASFNTDIGSRNDPGRAAERSFQQATAENGPYGSEARWEGGRDNQHWYQPLQRDEAA